MQIINAITNPRNLRRHGVQIATAAALLCLLVVVLSVIWQIFSHQRTKRSNYSPQAVSLPAADTTPTYQVSEILAANLFGNPSPKPVIRQAPKTTLNLTLQGILWATDDTMARAIIQSGKQASELYSIGETIKGAGASIKEIRDGEVLLDRNGAIESLPLIKKSASGNRQLITYNQVGRFPDDPVLPQTLARQASAAKSLGQQVKARSPNGAPRKIKRPNFSGMDKALKKMGEL